MKVDPEVLASLPSPLLPLQQTTMGNQEVSVEDLGDFEAHRFIPASVTKD